MWWPTLAEDSPITPSARQKPIIAVADNDGRPPKDPNSTSISDIEVDQIMAAFRTELRGSQNTTEKELLRAVGRKLGFIRVGRNARTALKGHLRAAIRRQIVAREGDYLVLATPIFRQYDNPFLVKTARAVMRPGLEYVDVADASIPDSGKLKTGDRVCEV